MIYGAGTGTVQGWTERKTKNPTRVGVGLGGGDSGGSRPLIELCAHHHRRRSDPWHQTRLPAAMTLAQRFAVAGAEKFIGRRDEQGASARQANIFSDCRLRRETSRNGRSNETALVSRHANDPSAGARETSHASSVDDARLTPEFPAGLEQPVTSRSPGRFRSSTWRVRGMSR